MASEGKIDSVYDFTSKGLRELESWLEPWIKGFLKGQLNGGTAPVATNGTLQSYYRDGAATVASGVARWYPPNSCTINKIHVGVGVAPVGSGLTVRVNRNGASIGTVTVVAGTFTATFVPTVTTFVLGDYITVDITAIGSTTAGSAVLVQFFGKWS